MGYDEKSVVVKIIRDFVSNHRRLLTPKMQKPSAIPNPSQESYQLDELTELKEQEAEEIQAKREEAERKTVEDKLRLSFLDTTMNLFDDLFNADDVPEHIQVLNIYPGLREEYKEKVTELLKTLYAQVQEKNEERLKKVAAFNAEFKRWYIAETQEPEPTEPIQKHFTQKMFNPDIF